MFRVAINTAFVPDNNVIEFKLAQLDPDSTVKNHAYPRDFKI